MTDKIRLLVCHDCQSIEELPDYHGPPEYDVLLDQAVEAHRFPNGEEHIGVLTDVETRHWNNNSTRAEILKQIGRGKKPGEAEGAGSEFYATSNTYQADALKCYGKHGRPEGGCIDWQIDKKRIGNPTKAGWQIGPKIYLCDFCPVATWVKTQQRSQAGAYDE